MTKYKIGDKVVCKNVDFAEYELQIGETYEITGIVPYSHPEPEYYIDGGKLSWMESRFELFEEWASHQTRADNETELALAKDQIASLQQALKQAKELLRVSYHTADSIQHMKNIKEFLGE
jgi:hypothetical protein